MGRWFTSLNQKTIFPVGRVSYPAIDTIYLFVGKESRPTIYLFDVVTLFGNHISMASLKRDFRTYAKAPARCRKIIFFFIIRIKYIFNA